MGIAQIGFPSLILIIIIALIIFGPKKLPEIGKAAGQTLREFKSSTNELMSDPEEEEKQTQKAEESSTSHSDTETDKS